jgi:hypothetical protein
MTAAGPETSYPLQQGARAIEHSLLRRIAYSLGTFAKRSPLSAFWGCIAAAIIVMAIAAPVFAPYEPLKSDFRAM